MSVTKTHSKAVKKKHLSASNSLPPLPARRPAWLASPELDLAIQETAHLVKSFDNVDQDELRQLTRRRLKEEVNFIGNKDFGEPSAGRMFFGCELGLKPRTAENGLAALRRSGVDLPIHLSRMCEAPLLTPDQERMLFQRMNFLLQQAAAQRSALDAKRPSRVRLQLIDHLIALAEWHRDRIVEANLRLVFSIVKKFVNPSCVFDELLSDGIIAIIRAVEKFDFDRGFRFSTYATQVIRRSAYQTVCQKQEERQTMLGGLQDMDLDISDEPIESAISIKRWHELRARLSVMMEQLDRREKFIICGRFALGAHRRVYTLQSLADRLGVSKERVRQLERRALDKLQNMVSELPDDLQLA